MAVTDYSILAPCGVRTNYSDWSDFRNAFGSKEYTPKRPPSKKLVASAIREFEGFCKTYHIDASKYSVIEPCQIEDEWRQFDFMDTAKNPSKISVHSIITRANGTIIQRIIDIG